ncbi:MAG TPA: alpha-glucan family phosphorylase [Acidimicrobiales bacterium]|nr:alpha-glucan family phosphorylase [Acidimicrobiales bacterium]
MKAFRSFTVRARLPEPLVPLQELAFNLRWSWDERTRDVFRWVDPQLWELTQHDPVQVLSLVARERLEALSKDNAFMSFLGEIHADLGRYMHAPRWFQNRGRSALVKVAYFSPEFGIAEALPQYSGGLGILAGDHLKAASSLGVPMVGVGLLYREGYFRQRLNADGWQEERYPVTDPHGMALTPIEEQRVAVDLAGQVLTTRIWVAAVGRVKLYLLDANVDENSDELRSVTDRLYGGGTEHRLRQEILLGIGGVRALNAVGEKAQIFHSNEGHAGFLGLERIRQLITLQGLNFAEAIEAARAGTIFTTHTPVPAGIDRFPAELMEKYFSGWAHDCGVDISDLMALGHAPGEPPNAPFNMAVMGLRLAAMANGVAKLHGRTSRSMFQSLYPSVPVEEVPITSVTNGVHGRTWTSSGMNDLFTKYVNPSWEDAGPEDWARINDARDDELWRAREQGKEALVGYVRSHLKASLVERGVSPIDAAWADDVLDPTVLTIGFARRFASYKRATLLLSQPERLKELLLDSKRPVQVIFGGKAHPADDLGKEMIRQIVQFASEPAVRHCMAFIEDYDIAVARTLLQGCDVWLNNPRRPMEASGTSGQKAALNGAINCSVLDGWWDEMFDGKNGWQIASAESYADLRRDEVEANSLFEILERQIVPLYYDRGGDRFPRQWVARIKDSLSSLAPRVQASRMVRDYVQTMYEPMAKRAEALSANKFARAKELATWKRRVIGGWETVAVLSVDIDSSALVTDLGATRHATTEVALGELSPSEVAVELLHGPVTGADEMSDWDAIAKVRMELVKKDDVQGTSTWGGSFVCDLAGRHGFTVRVVPSHSDLPSSAEMGLVAWAKST